MTEIVITCKAYGNISVYKGTRENALSLFENHSADLPQEVINIVEDDNTKYFVSAALLPQFIVEAVETPVGEPLRTLTRLKKQDVLNTADMVQEATMFVLKNETTLKELKKGYISEQLLNAIKEVSFVKDFMNSKDKECVIVSYDEYFNYARTVNTIKKNAYKETVSEEKIIRYILEFINDVLVDRKDCEYSVTKIQDKT